jgi:outer membrane murein-binding lipoprotein Lpp
VSGPPEEPPTRRIDPLPPPTGVREREVVAEEPGVERAAVLDEVRSLKTATAIIGVISILALGAALWALLDNDGDSGRDATGASNERVSDLEQRVDRLENDVEDTASDKAVSELRQDVEQLDDRVAQASRRAGQSSGGDEETQQAIEQLGQNVEQLDQRVDDVEQAQQQQESQPPADTGESPP